MPKPGDDAFDMRQQSWRKVTKHGLPHNDLLPLLEDIHIAVSPEGVASRLLCMYAIAAVGYGFPASSALDWIKRENLETCLARSERKMLTASFNNTSPQLQVQAAYSLAWCVSLVSRQCVLAEIPDDFVEIFPDIRVGETSANFADKIEIRAKDELFAYQDNLYCLHWAMREARLTGSRQPVLRWLPVIEAQRRAIEWLASGEGWDEISLDT